MRASSRDLEKACKTERRNIRNALQSLAARSVIAARAGTATAPAAYRPIAANLPAATAARARPRVSTAAAHRAVMPHAPGPARTPQPKTPRARARKPQPIASEPAPAEPARPAPTPEPPDLRATLAALITAHGLPTTLDAAWDVARELFGRRSA